jgi:ABC-2 type transport system ATP-binding protein
MTCPSVYVENVCKSYSRNAVLKRLNLSVWPGEIYGMLGSNGSGKSTLLRIIAGALHASSGNVTVAGTTGYVAQKFSLYEDLLVEENVAFSGRCYGLYGRELRNRVDETLERFDLREVRRQRTALLSHGWKQRLALAAAVCHRPSVLLLDEPTAGIDPVARHDFWDIFADCARSGATVLLATHHVDEADLCDRVGYLSCGELLACSSPAEFPELDGISHSQALTSLVRDGEGA